MPENVWVIRLDGHTKLQASRQGLAVDLREPGQIYFLPSVSNAHEGYYKFLDEEGSDGRLGDKRP